MSRISGLRLILDSFSGLMKRHMSLAFFLTMLVGLGGKADNAKTSLTKPHVCKLACRLAVTLRHTPWFMLLFEHVWMWTVLTCFDGIMAVSPCHNILRSSYLWWFEHLNPSIARERRWSKCGAHSAATGLGQHGEGGMWWTRPWEAKMRNENNIFNRSDHASSSSLTRGGQGKDRKRTRREVNTM